MDALGDATNLSMLEAERGYWQVKEDRDKIALVSLHALFRFIWMPFDLKAHPGRSKVQ